MVQRSSAQAYSRWKRFKTDELFNTYKILRNKVNIVIKNAKTKFYENKLTEVIDSKKNNGMQFVKLVYPIKPMITTVQQILTT